MGQNFPRHMVIDGFLVRHKLGIFGSLVIEDFAVLIPLDFRILIHHGQAIRNFVQQLFIIGHFCQRLAQHRHKDFRGKIDFIRSGVLQSRDNSLVDRLLLIQLIQLHFVLDGNLCALFFQFIDLGGVIYGIQRTVRQHLVNALLRDGIAAPQRLHDRILAVHKFFVLEDFAVFVFFKCRVQLNDFAAVLRQQFVFLVTCRLAQLVEDGGGINQLHIALAFRALVLGQNPDIGGDTRVVKQVGGQCDNGFQQILFQNPAANLAFARCRTARKQRTAVFDNRSATHVVVHLVNSRLHKNQLGVAAARQTCTPASILAALKLVADSILLPGLGVFSCPRRAERRIFQHEAHLDVGEAILFESIGIAEVFNVLPFNHHLCQTDSVGLGHKLLTE